MDAGRGGRGLGLGELDDLIIVVVVVIEVRIVEDKGRWGSGGKVLVHHKVPVLTISLPAISHRLNYTM